MLDWETGESTSRVIVVVGIAEEGGKEGLRDCSLNIGEFQADILFCPLDKLPLLLEQFLESRVGRLKEVFSDRC